MEIKLKNKRKGRIIGTIVLIIMLVMNFMTHSSAKYVIPGCIVLLGFLAMVIPGLLLFFSLLRIRQSGQSCGVIRLKYFYTIVHVTIIAIMFGILTGFAVSAIFINASFLVEICFFLFESVALLMLYVVYITARVKK